MTTIKDDNLFGFYASFNSDDDEQKQVKDLLWGDNGLKKKLESLKWYNYGQDFHLIQFQFYINPIQHLRNNLREIESYRRKEKSIGIPLIIDKNNFFEKNSIDRQLEVKRTILYKLELLKDKIKRNQLDLDSQRLLNDVRQLL
jgi:hypothetical protein